MSTLIAAWRPATLSVAASVFAREAVTGAAPGTPARAKALLFAAGRLGVFAEGAGLELSPEVLLEEAVIERFIACGSRALSPATRRTLRTNLRALSRALERYPSPAGGAAQRARQGAIHRRVRSRAICAWQARSQPRARRMRASAVICLGAGAGIVAGELRHLRGSDVLGARAGCSWVEAAARGRARCRCLRAFRSRWPRPPPSRGRASHRRARSQAARHQ